MAEETPDQPPENNPPENNGTPPRVPLRQRIKARFNKAANSEPVKIIKDTAEDLRTNNKERWAFGVATIIPGGWIGYGAHRVHKYHKKNADNDDGAAPDAPAPQQPPPKPPKP
jgi:hypothetical protein